METQTLVDWLRRIADDVERRGIEEMSVSGFSSIGTVEVTDEEDKVKSYKPTKDFFLAMNWRYATE